MYNCNNNNILYSSKPAFSCVGKPGISLIQRLEISKGLQSKETLRFAKNLIRLCKYYTFTKPFSRRLRIIASEIIPWRRISKVSSFNPSTVEGERNRVEPPSSTMGIFPRKSISTCCASVEGGYPEMFALVVTIGTFAARTKSLATVLSGNRIQMSEPSFKGKTIANAPGQKNSINLFAVFEKWSTYFFTSSESAIIKVSLFSSTRFFTL